LYSLLYPVYYVGECLGGADVCLFGSCVTLGSDDSGFSEYAIECTLTAGYLFCLVILVLLLPAVRYYQNYRYSALSYLRAKDRWNNGGPMWNPAVVQRAQVCYRATRRCQALGPEIRYLCTVANIAPLESTQVLDTVMSYLPCHYIATKRIPKRFRSVRIKACLHALTAARDAASLASKLAASDTASSKSSEMGDEEVAAGDVDSPEARRHLLKLELELRQERQRCWLKLVDQEWGWRPGSVMKGTSQKVPPIRNVQPWHLEIYERSQSESEVRGATVVLPVA